jgi:hypothetical protein
MKVKAKNRTNEFYSFVTQNSKFCQDLILGLKFDTKTRVRSGKNIVIPGRVRFSLTPQSLEIRKYIIRNKDKLFWIKKIGIRYYAILNDKKYCIVGKRESLGGRIWISPLDSNFPHVAYFYAKICRDIRNVLDSEIKINKSESLNNETPR